ncbi:MAG: hypothetical protein ACI87Q_002122 [Pseudohongiellaceae bacterium]|jgi:hypothetical protein
MAKPNVLLVYPLKAITVPSQGNEFRGLGGVAITSSHQVRARHRHECEVLVLIHTSVLIILIFVADRAVNVIPASAYALEARALMVNTCLSGRFKEACDKFNES